MTMNFGGRGNFLPQNRNRQLCSCPADRAIRRTVLCKPETDGRSRGRNLYFTVTDNTDNLYIVKGNNPLCLYHWPKLGLYLYASTEDILKRALQGIRLKLGKPQEVNIDSGEIVRIDRFGRITRSIFDTSHLFRSRSYFGWPTAFPSGTTIPLMTAMCPN